MIATRPATLRQQVILLLREQGYTPIEATEKWDSVYSLLFKRATPGTHKFIIGAYTLEFTKEGTPENEGVISATDPVNYDFPLWFTALILIGICGLVAFCLSLIL